MLRRPPAFTSETYQSERAPSPSAKPPPPIFGLIPTSFGTTSADTNANASPGTVIALGSSRTSASMNTRGITIVMKRQSKTSFNDGPSTTHAIAKSTPVSSSTAGYRTEKD
ncbi:MAG: hypothetical protein IPF82_00875 [Blastocatellia bacterium]|nr:hypothetical protein [Blastocatellia bacterium]